MMTTIAIDEKIAAALTAQAEARGLTLDAYLRSIVEGSPNPAPPNPSRSVGEIERGVTELMAHAPDFVPLPIDSTRVDIHIEP